MEFYTPNFVPNKSDDSGRYAYNKQPEIMRWNCNNFGETINYFLKYVFLFLFIFIIKSAQERDNVLNKYFDLEFQKEHKNIMISKLCLVAGSPYSETLIETFMKSMELTCISSIYFFLVA